jgi:anti-anti-sigma regulatory factor
MLIIIKENIKEEDFDAMKNSSDNEIAIDLSSIKYLSSKEITKILILIKKFNKKIEFINCNSHIVETIKVLNLSDMITVKN